MRSGLFPFFLTVQQAEYVVVFIFMALPVIQWMLTKQKKRLNVNF
jgi:hypothetical protein